VPVWLKRPRTKGVAEATLWPTCTSFCVAEMVQTYDA
jgi:hypothetical protein